MAKINKKMSITEIVQSHPEAANVLAEAGMHCIGCAAARFESLEQGAAAHGIDPDALVKELNKKLSK